MHVLNVFQGIAIWQTYRLKDNIENILDTSEHYQSQSETTLQNKKCDDRGAKNRNWHYLLGKERKGRKQNDSKVSIFLFPYSKIYYKDKPTTNKKLPRLMEEERLGSKDIKSPLKLLPDLGSIRTFRHNLRKLRSKPYEGYCTSWYLLDTHNPCLMLRDTDLMLDNPQNICLRLQKFKAVKKQGKMRNCYSPEKIKKETGTSANPELDPGKKKTGKSII